MEYEAGFPDAEQWFALEVRFHHEKVVAKLLEAKGFRHSRRRIPAMRNSQEKFARPRVFVSGLRVWPLQPAVSLAEHPQRQEFTASLATDVSRRR